jgi:sugar phosphate permease
MAFWLPTLIVVEKGYPLTVAGFLVAVGAALTAPSNFLGGYLSDRLRNPYLVVGGSLVVLALNNLMLVRATSLPLLLAAVAVNGIFVQLYFGPLFAIPLELSSVRSAGLASGFGNFFANLGSFTIVYTLGVLKDFSGSFDLGLVGLSALCLVGLGCTIVLNRSRRRQVFSSA